MGVGLRNTRERLRQLYGEDAELTLEDVGGGVQARLGLPFAVHRSALPPSPSARGAD